MMNFKAIESPSVKRREGLVDNKMFSRKQRRYLRTLALKRKKKK